MFIGIIISSSKPHYGTISIPLFQQIRESFLYPLMFKTLDGDVIRLRLITILVILDMGERSKVLHMNGAIGYFGCHCCYSRGKYLRKKGVRFPGILI